MSESGEVLGVDEMVHPGTTTSGVYWIVKPGNTSLYLPRKAKSDDMFVAAVYLFGDSIQQSGEGESH